MCTHRCPLPSRARLSIGPTELSHRDRNAGDKIRFQATAGKTQPVMCISGGVSEGGGYWNLKRREDLAPIALLPPTCDSRRGAMLLWPR